MRPKIASSSSSSVVQRKRILFSAFQHSLRASASRDESNAPLYHASRKQRDAFAKTRERRRCNKRALCKTRFALFLSLLCSSSCQTPPPFFVRQRQKQRATEKTTNSLFLLRKIRSRRFPKKVISPSHVKERREHLSATTTTTTPATEENETKTNTLITSLGVNES